MKRSKGTPNNILSFQSRLRICGRLRKGGTITLQAGLGSGGVMLGHSGGLGKILPHPLCPDHLTGPALPLGNDISLLSSSPPPGNTNPVFHAC